MDWQCRDCSSRCSTLPPAACCAVFAGAPNSNPVGSAEVDERGRFVMENLSAGQYELTLQSFPVVPGPGARRVTADRRLVQMPDSGEVQVTLVFNQSTPP